MRTPFRNVDASWLRMDDPVNLMVVTGVLVLGAPVPVARLRELVEKRLLRFRRFTSRVAPPFAGVGLPDWEPVVTMRMASDVANRFFQGKESVPLALALGRVKLSGPPLTLLQLAPVTNPIHPVYRAWLKESGLDHLVA